MKSIENLGSIHIMLHFNAVWLVLPSSPPPPPPHIVIYVRVVLGSSDWRFGNLSGHHHPGQVKSFLLVKYSKSGWWTDQSLNWKLVSQCKLTNQVTWTRITTLDQKTIFYLTLTMTSTEVFKWSVTTIDNNLSKDFSHNAFDSPLSWYIWSCILAKYMIKCYSCVQTLYCIF